MEDKYGVQKLYADVMKERLVTVVGELGIGKKAVVRKVAELMDDRKVFEHGIVIIENKDNHCVDDIIQKLLDIHIIQDVLKEMGIHEENSEEMFSYSDEDFEIKSPKLS